MKWPKQFGLPIAMTLLLCLWWWEQWYVKYLYHGGYAHRELLPFLGCLAVGVFSASTALCTRRLGAVALRAILVLSLSYWIWTSLKVQWGWNRPLPSLVKIPLWVLTVVIAVWLARRRDAVWTKAVAAAIVGLAIYAATPALVAQVNRLADATILKFPWASTGSQPRPNLVYVIFDETSPAATDPWIQSLQAQGQRHERHTIAAAGNNTVDAVPAMFTGRTLSAVAGCGASLLCSATASIDFSRFHAAESDIDIVGFWHPYCSIQGLRSCYRERGVFLNPLLEGFVCAVPIVGSRLPCDLPAGSRDGHLERLQRAAFAAPFWTRGGALLIHLPLPHPSFERNRQSLREEYQHSIGRADALIHLLLERLTRRFGDDFLLVLTTDHPLRLATWCARDGFYSSPSCAQELPVNEGAVPFIIVGPSSTALAFQRTTAVGLLGP